MTYLAQERTWLMPDRWLIWLGQNRDGLPRCLTRIWRTCRVWEHTYIYIYTHRYVCYLTFDSIDSSGNLTTSSENTICSSETVFLRIRNVLDLVRIQTPVRNTSARSPDDWPTLPLNFLFKIQLKTHQPPNFDLYTHTHIVGKHWQTQIQIYI